MVSDSVLRKIVGANFFFASSGADLPSTLSAVFLRFLALPVLEQAGTQNR